MSRGARVARNAAEQIGALVLIVLCAWAIYFAIEAVWLALP